MIGLENIIICRVLLVCIFRGLWHVFLELIEEKKEIVAQSIVKAKYVATNQAI